jgi:TetR/AcrR family transcriptional regulator, cholesterol catabolism regulator
MRVAPKGQRVKLQRETSSDRVLVVAARLFREKGYLAASVREIAQAANMKSSSLYYHYASKEALLEAVMNLAITTLIEAVGRAIDQTPASMEFRDRLRNAVGAHLAVIHEHVDIVIASRQLLNTLPEPARAEHLALRRRYAEMWRELLESGKSSGDIAPDADLVLIEMFVLGALNWTSEWLDPARTSFERLSDTLMRVLLDGVGGGPTARPAVAAKQAGAARARAASL